MAILKLTLEIILETKSKIEKNCQNLAENGANRATNVKVSLMLVVCKRQILLYIETGYDLKLNFLNHLFSENFLLKVPQSSG